MLAVLNDDRFLDHETGAHPEHARRLVAINEALSPGFASSDRIRQLAARPATDAELLRIHTAGHLRRIEELAAAGGGRLDPDTVVSPASPLVARLAAGAACVAAATVLSSETRRALVLSRPPGHHALPERAMGFCLFANAAIAARSAQADHGVERVLIVDWDVHHGNGTQDIFYEDGQIVFFSMHRFPFWPGSGAQSETGQGAGLGATFNQPVSFGTARRRILDLFAQGLERAVNRARPELIILSAGFDAHVLDPIGSLGLETEDFGTLTDMVRQAADAECGGRLVSLLEGGYHPQALGECVRLHAERLTAG